MHSRHAGLTLLELTIVLAIVAILATLATSAYGAAMSRARIADARAALSSALFAAQRVSAINDVHVVLCPSPEGKTCEGGTEWARGWIGFADRNGDRRRQPAETLTAYQPSMHPSLRLRSSRGRTRLVFQPRGGANTGSNVTFTLCTGRDSERAVALVLANGGRLRVATPTAARRRQDCE